MARHKSKKPQQLDIPMLLDSSEKLQQSRGRVNTSASPALLFIIIFTIGASVMGWFCVQQQQSLDQLATSFTTMQRRIAALQQVMEMTDTQTDEGSGVEERIFALEEAQKQAQEMAEVALATSEKLKNSDLFSQLLTLNDEMDTQLAEIKQASLSVTTLQAMFKNHSEEFEAMKESVVAGLISSSVLAKNVEGMTNTVANVYSRADDQVTSVEALSAQLEGQASKLSELKESLHLHNRTLHTNDQRVAAIKELIEAKQAMRAQALEEMLSSVQMILDEQFVTSQTLHSSVKAQLQTFHTQLASAPSWSMKLKSNEVGPAVPAKILSTITQNNTEDKLEDVEEKTGQQDDEDAVEDEAKEEEAIQEEPTLEEEMEGDLIKGLWKEEIIEQEEEFTEEEEEITEEEDEFTEEEEEEEEITEEEEEITEQEEEITEEEEEIIEQEEEITEQEEEITEEEEEITEEEEEIIEQEEEITEQEEEITEEEIPEEEEEITEQEEEITEQEDGITEQEGEITEEEEEITEQEEEITEQEDGITEQEEEITEEEQGDKEIPGQSDDQQAVGEPTEEEVTEEMTEDRDFAESSEEDVSEEVVESWETIE